MSEKRLHRIDTLRGFLLLNMIAYHALWDAVFIFRYKIFWFTGVFGVVWERFIAIGFIAISGYCYRLGKHHTQRGLLLLLCGAVVSAVTLVVMPRSPIYYGILTFIGACTLLFIPIEKYISKINPVIGIAASLVLFVAFYNVSSGRVLFFDLPSGIYVNMFTAALGFPSPKFSSADYFPLLPWVFAFFFGFFIHDIIKHPKWLEGKQNPLSLIGRHTLPIYMLHQPIIYGLMFIFHSLT